MGELKKRISSAQIIILGFAGLILLGSLILMLPMCTANKEGASFLDALFTATSAACVTGLIVQNTATYWSGIGQFVIISLIQIGGLGIVTVAILIEIFSGKKIGLKERSTMQDAISAHNVGGIVKLTGFILKTTLLFEMIGALLMAPAFCREFGFWKGIWYGGFHSISAFCNAGFDLMGVKEQFSSLTYFADHPIINLTIMGLIICGGLGFMTWEDVLKHRIHWRKYRMQSKVILVTTACLIMIPSLYFFFFEYAKLPLAGRILRSLFQSVTPRTAGFNTTDLALFSEIGIAIVILLMLIGGSPGSTAGGMKTTTIAVLLATSLSVFRRKEDAHFFGRRIENETIRNAATIFLMYITLCLFGGFAISTMEQLPLLTCLYETASAIGTVGLTLGVTPQLGAASQIILILLMYAGRVGGLTLIFAAVSGKRESAVRFPKEKLTVG
jgi:trk system potassium uptake protein TrkH